MGFIKDAFLGGAEEKAAEVQAQSGREAIAEQREARKVAREDLAPFREVGETRLEELGRLTTDPEAQREFITKNPFFKALADDAQRRLFQNQAARGKVGSGETAKALQNSLLLLGNEVLSEDIRRRFNLASLGQSSAAGQATTALQTGQNISELTTQIGNVRAAGIIGKAEQRRGTITDIGTAIALSDRRMKTDIQKIGELSSGLPVYTFKYIGEDDTQIGCMADEVEELFPEAVLEIDGIKYVDYGEIKCH